MRSAFRHPLRERLERGRASPIPAPEPDEPRDALPLRLPPLGRAQVVDALTQPDLLNPTAMASLDRDTLIAALTFSFIAEDDAGAIDAALDRASLAPSSFDPACYFRELFVEELRRSTMQVHASGKPVRVHERYVLRVLSQPPAELAAVAARRAVFAELLASPPLRASVESLHDALHALFKLLRGDGAMGIRGEHARRRIEVLKRIAGITDALAAEPLAGTRSLLARLPRYAQALRDSDGFKQLFDLVRYERERAFAELTVQLGADGTIRALSLSGLRELRTSRYHRSVLSSWLGQLWLWLKGYKITEGEVLDRWLDQVFAGVASCLPTLLQLLADLDVYRSGLAFHDTCSARGLPTCFAELDDAGHGEGALTQLYNPLLFASVARPVCCSVALGARGVTTLITGPNSGGKTRLLQALGIAQLLAQNGFPVPAQSARLRAVPGIFASLTQQTSAEQPEGRLGTELLRIRMLFERSELGSLLLVDELCSGTSPSEGEELFRLVLELLAELEPTSFVSTHFLSFAAELARVEGGLRLAFLQVELDREERPTHRFVPGVAVTSLAHKTAARLGVTREELRALVAERARQPRAE
jgi:DNA mismatch repair protein MutS2